MPTAALLAADIGGTRARFLHVPRTRGAAPQRFELACSDFPDFEALLACALAQPGIRAGAGLDAALAVAGPVRDGRVEFTRLPWRAEAAALKQRFGLRRVMLLNDMEAAAWALAEQHPADTPALRAGRDTDKGRCVLLSVGTGLGSVYWSRLGGRLHVEPAEAGHSGFAPSCEWEVDYLRVLRRRYGERISWERLLCGAGLALLHAHLGGSDALLMPAAVVERAAAGEAAAREALRRFSALLGNLAGDLVLAAPAAGGVWLAGGVLAGMDWLFDPRPFLQSFDNKGRLAPLLAEVPVRRSGDGDLGLRGARHAARAWHQA